MSQKTRGEVLEDLAHKVHASLTSAGATAVVETSPNRTDFVAIRQTCSLERRWAPHTSQLQYIIKLEVALGHLSPNEEET